MWNNKHFNCLSRKTDFFVSKNIQKFKNAINGGIHSMLNSHVWTTVGFGLNMIQGSIPNAKPEKYFEERAHQSSGRCPVHAPRIKKRNKNTSDGKESKKKYWCGVWEGTSFLEWFFSGFAFVGSNKRCSDMNWRGRKTSMWTHSPNRMCINMNNTVQNALAVTLSHWARDGYHLVCGSNEAMLWCAG